MSIFSETVFGLHRTSDRTCPSRACEFLSTLKKNNFLHLENCLSLNGFSGSALRPRVGCWRILGRRRKAAGLGGGEAETMELQPRPQLPSWGALELAWPSEIVPLWGKGRDLCMPESASVWQLAAPPRGITLGEVVPCSWLGTFLRAISSQGWVPWPQKWGLGGAHQCLPSCPKESNP